MKDWDYDREIVMAKQNEAYHRKQMEYFQEQIKLFESRIPKKAKPSSSTGENKNGKN